MDRYSRTISTLAMWCLCGCDQQTFPVQDDIVVLGILPGDRAGALIERHSSIGAIEAWRGPRRRHLQPRQRSAFGSLFLNLRVGTIAVSSQPMAFMAFSIAALKRSRRTLTAAIGPSTGINALTLIRSWFSASRMRAPLASNSPDSRASITDCTIGLTSSRSKLGRPITRPTPFLNADLPLLSSACR